MKKLPVLSLVFLPLFALAQKEIRINTQDSTEGIEVIFIPREMTADSLMQYIYNFDSSRYGIGHTQRFGWLMLFEKFDTDSFYQWTGQYCIERVGEQRRRAANSTLCRFETGSFEKIHSIFEKPSKEGFLKMIPT